MILSLLVLLVTAATGAWAQSSQTATHRITASFTDIGFDHTGTLDVTLPYETTLYSLYCDINSVDAPPIGIYFINASVTSGTNVSLGTLNDWDTPIIITGIGDATVSMYLKLIENDFTNPLTISVNPISPYTVKMKEGTKDAEHWSISPPEASTTGVAEGDAVTLKYNGRLKVKSVTATSDAEPDPLTVPLTVEAVTDGTIKVNISNGSGTLTTGMKFSVDGGDKNLITTTTDIPVQAGHKVQFYGNEDKTQVYGGIPFVWIQGFGQGFKCNVYGNIMSLLDEEGYATMTDLPDKSDIFASLFYGNSALVDASGLLLPAKTMKNNCYNSMFYYCNNLTAAPDLPATTLAVDCYNGMFEGCNLLSVAPDLPATTLAESCYEAMFSNCFSLTAPPVLPAKALVNKCYNHMFFECWKITSITCLATSDTSEANNTDGWLLDAGKDAFGPKTFTADPSATWPLGTSGIPEGWTRLNPDGSTYNP